MQCALASSSSEKDERGEPYQLLTRLFSEQCECSEESVQVKKKTEGSVLQSPYDPDASCGHKGPGYSLHIAETCDNGEKPEIITDYEVHGAARSDIGKALSVIERLDAAGYKPDTLFADGGYPSVPSALKVKKKASNSSRRSTAAGCLTTSWAEIAFTLTRKVS